MTRLQKLKFKMRLNFVNEWTFLIIKMMCFACLTFLKNKIMKCFIQMFYFTNEIMIQMKKKLKTKKSLYHFKKFMKCSNY